MKCRECGSALRCPHCTGRAGGSATSDAKKRAARENGRKGGRPKNPKRP